MLGTSQKIQALRVVCSSIEGNCHAGNSEELNNDDISVNTRIKLISKLI